jgi:hypothetical protein
MAAWKKLSSVRTGLQRTASVDLQSPVDVSL